MSDTYIEVKIKMKSIYVTFEDEDAKKLEKIKGELGWRDAILKWAGVE